MNKFRHVLVIMAILFAVSTGYAQEDVMASVETMDQLALDSIITVPSVTAEGPTFVVIHADDGTGSPGAVLGQAWVDAGEHTDVTVRIDATQATPTLYVMLHVDDGEEGVFEFGTVEGADAPILIDGEVAVTPMTVQILGAHDQIAEDTVVIDTVTVAQPTWVVIHSGDFQNFGESIGQTLVEAGTTTNVTIEIDAEARTPVLWPMLHADTGTEGEYEFGEVADVDLPITLGDEVATLPISSIPIIRVGADSLVLNSNGVIRGETATLMIGSVLSDGPGFLAIHNEVDGNSGEIIGFAAVGDGLTRNITVEVDATMLTPNLWPMLHTDDNTLGEFEFGQVEDADAPVIANDQMVGFAFPAAPFIQYTDQAPADNTLTISRVWYNSSGFVAIHADDGSGKLGEVIGFTAIQPGLSTDVVIELDAEAMTETLYPVLHQDTEESGVFEFESVEGADGPVLVNNSEMVGTLSLEAAVAAGDCTVAAAGSEANLRDDTSTEAEIVGTLTQEEARPVLGQAQGLDGFLWYQVADDSWVRSDVVELAGNCD